MARLPGVPIAYGKGHFGRVAGVVEDSGAYLDGGGMSFRGLAL